ncbi:5-methylcytosine-specific restriction endonuclease McrBC regulatory subunit McrC [Filimonas zeae]|uniref:5-methylcytosine restriction system specificity protein McrC n=1 Tax=Filimonas zeae TaxID=1737353 RepID=UPI0016666D05|nr:restriction endonuclease [Filimonas zeae]MDR6339829.1 5-methylcytosine-specific restriction endonuclease McrBC regulatory subunit McrC [Filimonas zeae]
MIQQKNAQTFSLTADYYVGVDWLVKEKKVIQVEPKINTKLAAIFDATTNDPDPEMSLESPNYNLPPVEYQEIDYLKILLDIMAAGLPSRYTENLVLIDWNTSQIPVTQQEDRLTPFLIIQFLQLLKVIVRKGLKKSYYKVQKNLTNTIKGKILVGSNIKQNILKSRSLQTFCEYQVFGADNIENRFLKKVLRFAVSYIENNKSLFTGDNLTTITHLTNYCRPAFEQIGNELNEDQLKQVRYSAFFKEYKEAIAVGRQILRKFAYNLSETANKEIKTPPFWIDMPRLFELYCYTQLLKANPQDKDYIHYQFSTYGNVLDVLISKPGCELVIDAKYKLQYQKGQIHQDIRQVAGYARLNKVRNQLAAKAAENIACLIMYPDMNAIDFSYSLSNLLRKAESVAAYCKVYKLGIRLPVIEKSGFSK